MSNTTDIIFEPWRAGAEVSLEQMLAAREKRFRRQRELLEAFQKPLISFTMNIAGSIKQSGAISRAFQTGCRELEKMLCAQPKRMVFKDCDSSRTGDQAFYIVDAPAAELKALCVKLEDSHPLGRLFDLDVFDTDGRPVSRRLLGAEERGCMICGAPGKSCAAGRVHSVQELREHTADRIYHYFLETDAAEIMSMAAKSLRYEAWTSPKPGLVDMNNNGVHKDMDMTTLMCSVSVIADYFRRFFLIGVETAQKPPAFTFKLLRAEGLRAEQEMLAATKGVNTHKGAIFLFGVLCGASGRRWHPRGLFRDLHALFRDCSIMTESTLRRELDALSAANAVTYGEHLYLRHNCRGARGTVMDGFPEVAKVSLPVLKRGVELGMGIFPSGRSALLHLIASADDSNMLHRNSPETRDRICARLAALLESDPYPDEETAAALDSHFIRLNLSPGGSADLLAVTYFAFFLENPDYE